MPGSLVLNQNGEILGIMTAITLQAHQGIYVTEVLPGWSFYDWLEEPIIDDELEVLSQS